jgi:alpha-ketoglutarate-dependent taurine dioxygenase
MATCARSLCRSARLRSHLHVLQSAEGSKAHISPVSRHVLMRGALRNSYSSASTSESNDLTEGSGTALPPLVRFKMTGKQSWEHSSLVRRMTSRNHEEVKSTRVVVRKHYVGKEPAKEQSATKQPVKGTPAKAKPVEENEVFDKLESTKSLWDSDAKPLVSSILLRDQCQCDQCIDPSTKQRSFSFHDIPENVHAVQGGNTDDGSFIVSWENDIKGFSNHTSTFSLEELKAMACGRSLRPIPRLEPADPWDATSIAERLMTVSYDDYMTSEKHFLEITKALQRDGLVFVKGVPSSTESVRQIVERIGPIRNTFYGSTWDVKSKPNAENVAYTDKELGFHMDLLYMDQPPKYQFLHCIQNTCIGGESRFLDITRVRQIMKDDFPGQADLLRRVSFKYHYHNNGHFYRSRRPIFVGNDQTWWSPPFVEAFVPSTKASVAASLAAVKQFASVLDREDLAYETKMEEGTCAIFENTRVLHARNAFDVNSGHRWLRGAYLDNQPLRSTYARLMREEAADGDSAV